MANARKRLTPAPPEARPERPKPTKAEVVAERFPNLDKNPALRRALAIHRALSAGKSREEAEALADEKYGPRAPKTAAKPAGKPKRGKRPEAPKRVRVKPVVKRTAKA